MVGFFLGWKFYFHTHQLADGDDHNIWVRAVSNVDLVSDGLKLFPALLRCHSFLPRFLSWLLEP